MKWGLQHVKVTLEESESGETIVIEQSSDGRVTCERGKERKAERAANTAPSAAKSEAPAAAPAKPKAERQQTSEARKAEDRPKAKTSPRKPRASRKSSDGRKTSLEWTPVRDHLYDGFAAPSGVGVLKVLLAKSGQWVLFFEVKGACRKRLGCFDKLGPAKKRAQELHDSGLPDTEPVTAEEVEACAAPPPAAPAKDEAPVAPPPTPPAEGRAEAEKDKQLIGTFSKTLDAVLDEDEDD